jgi:hypothetical protein
MSIMYDPNNSFMRNALSFFLLRLACIQSWYVFYDWLRRKEVNNENYDLECGWHFFEEKTWDEDTKHDICDNEEPSTVLVSLSLFLLM